MRKYHRRLMGHAVLLEGALLVVALLWAFIRHIVLWDSFLPSLSSFCLGLVSGVILLAVNYVAVEYGSRYFAFFRTIKTLMEQDIAPLFASLRFHDIIGLAVLSGVAEEAFFRGVLQAEIGILGTSLLFGIAHIWRKNALPYGIYAAIMGIYLGGLAMFTQSLWVPIIAHITNNFVALLYCQHISDSSHNQKLITKQVEL